MRPRLLAVLLLLLWPMLALAEPVDTRQFGLIREGMSEATVVARLGLPDTRTVIKRYAIASAHRGVVVAEMREQIALLYLGDGQIMHTHILLDNDRVVSKNKYK